MLPVWEAATVFAAPSMPLPHSPKRQQTRPPAAADAASCHLEGHGGHGLALGRLGRDRRGAAVASVFNPAMDVDPDCHGQFVLMTGHLHVLPRNCFH